MKALCIILALVTAAALGFGLTATSRLGALEAQVAVLSEKLTNAQTDLDLSQDIARQTDKALDGLKRELEAANEKLSGYEDGSAVAPEIDVPAAPPADAPDTAPDAILPDIAPDQAPAA